MLRNKSILLIVRRVYGDVFFLSSVIKTLHQNYENCFVDILVNYSTRGIADCLDGVRKIFMFEYTNETGRRYNAFKNLRRYDMSINFTSNDRSVIYAFLASKNCISAIDNESYKNWWKKVILKETFVWNFNEHIFKNYNTPLKNLNIKDSFEFTEIESSFKAKRAVKNLIKDNGVKKFIIFHPSAGKKYKMLPPEKIVELLNLLLTLKFYVIVTGGSSTIDKEVSSLISNNEKVLNLIGKLNIDEFIALSSLSEFYVGTDTLNTHIAASQNKRVFAIFGPTNLALWAPIQSSRQLEKISPNKPIQTYDNITIYRSDLPCMSCWKAGCLDKESYSYCLDEFDVHEFFNFVKSSI